jgi:hypothetical protein
MSEPAAWRYQKITKPMFDLAAPHTILAGRVIPIIGDIVEDGFVEMKDGKIAAVGPRTQMPAGPVIETGGTLMPGTVSTTWPASRWMTPSRSAPSRRRATC